MNSRTSGNVKGSKTGRAASSTKKPFNWLPVIIICVVLLILIVGGVIAWFLLFAPKSPEIIRFVADPNSIEVGQSTTLSWEIKNASVMEIKPIGEVESSGEIQVQPIQTTEYILIGKNEKGKTETKTLLVEVKDITPPNVNIIHSPSSLNTEDKVLFSASAEDAGGISKVEIAVNGEVVKSCTTSPCTYEGGPYSAGEISYNGIGYDKAGNKATTESKSFTVKTADVTPPSVTIKHSPASPNTKQKVLFSVSATDAGGISKVEIAVNGEVVKSCNISPCTYEGGPYPAGEISYNGIGYDKAGNKATTESKSLTVKAADVTPPSVMIKHSPESPNTKQKVAFIANARDAGSISKVEIAVNGEVVKSCNISPCTYEGGPYPAGSLNYGAYAYDKAGNKGSTGSKDFTVKHFDVTPPSVTIKHSPTSPTTKQKVAFIASAKDASGISKVQIAVNGRIVKSCRGAPCTYEGGPYPLGGLNYGAYAYDRAGNKKWSGSKSLTVKHFDVTPPNVIIKHSPTSPNTKQKVLFTASATDASGISKVQIAVNGRIVKSCSNPTCIYESEPYPAGALNYGAYAYDRAENKKWSGSKSLTVSKAVIVPIKPLPVKPIKPIPVKPIEIQPVKPIEIPPARPKDTTPPSVGIRYSPASPNTTQKVFFTASAADAEGISKVDIVVNGKVVKSCTSTPCTYEGGAYPVGSLKYMAYAYDKAGNKASTGSKSLTVSKPVLVPIKPIPVKPIEIQPVKPIEIPPARPKDTTPPSVGIRYSPASPNTTQKVFFTANAADAEGISKVDIVVNGKVVKSCTSTPCTYEGGAYPVGSLKYMAYAYDKAGNKASTGSKSLTVSRSFLMPTKPILVRPKDITPPSVVIRHSPASPNTLQKVTFSANATDSGGISKVEIAVNGKVVKSCSSSTCTYEGGPYPAGSLNYMTYAYDKAGNKTSTGSKSLTISKPVLTPIKRIPIQPIPRSINR